MLSVPCWIVDDWVATGQPARIGMFARDRKLIWIIHCLLFAPEKLSSPFHVATFARFWCGPYGNQGGKAKLRSQVTIRRKANREKLNLKSGVSGKKPL